MNPFLQTARPVLFESSSDGASPETYYGGVGSSFLVTYKSQTFFVTAKHLMEKQQASPESLCIFPTDDAENSIPFNQLYLLNPMDGQELEEYHDLYILRIDQQRQTSIPKSILYAIDLDISLMSPEQLQLGTKLAVIGFPSDTREVDYDNLKIKYKRSTMSAVFNGRSQYNYVYQLNFKDILNHTSIDGMSGSPIFSFDNNLNGLPRFLGILLRANIQKGYFMSSLVLKKALDDLEK